MGLLAGFDTHIAMDFNIASHLGMCMLDILMLMSLNLLLLTFTGFDTVDLKKLKAFSMKVM